jgi:hypothetical protein
MERSWSDVFVLSAFLVDCRYLGLSNDPYFQGGCDEGSGRLTLRRERVDLKPILRIMKLAKIQLW